MRKPRGRLRFSSLFPVYIISNFINQYFTIAIIGLLAQRRFCLFRGMAILAMVF